MENEAGCASLGAGDTEASRAIGEFGAKMYAEDEKKELCETARAFSDCRWTDLSEADMMRFKQMSGDITVEDMTETLCNNLPDVDYAVFRDAFPHGAIRRCKRDNEMKNIVLTDAEVWHKATRHFFSGLLGEARESAL